MRHDRGVDRSELGQIVDREALEAGGGARGRLRISVPAGWAGGVIEIAAPGRVACARCDGGGCDGCDRSGAHRTPAEPGERTLRLQLPDPLDPGGVVALRLVRPFGEGAALEQLLVEVTAGAEASPGVLRIAPAAAPVETARQLRGPALAAALFAVLALVAALIASR